MAGICVEKLPHSCGSRDALQIFEEDGEFTGYCFACGTYIPNPYEDKPKGYRPQVYRKTQEQIEAEIAEIKTLPSEKLIDRKLRKETLDYFGVKVGFDEGDGKTIKFHYYPYTRDGRVVGYKTRLVPEKRMWSVGDLKGCDFFGWEQAVAAGGKKLIICEGEIDCLTIFQVLLDDNKGGKWEHLLPAVISLPHGAAAAAKDLNAFLPTVRKHFNSDIIFVPDQDAAGEAAAEAVSRLFPEILIATLTDKDPNACLLNGKKKALISSILFKSSVRKNSRLIKASSIHEQAKEPPQMGLSWPFKQLTTYTRGKRFGEVRYFGAGTKLGKSELVNTLAAHDIKEHGLNVFLAKPEESINKTYKLLAGKMVGKFFHDPNIPFDEEAYEEAGKVIGDHAFLIDIYQFANWDSLKQDIKYAVTAEKVKEVYLDPITCFTNTMSAAEANEFLTGMTAEMAAMAKDLKFGANIFCHLKAPAQGTPHEFGGKVFSAQFAGSRAMQRACHLMIGMEGNKDSTLPLEERNIRDLVILEDREFGSSGRVRLYWDHKTGLFNEVGI